MRWGWGFIWQWRGGAGAPLRSPDGTRSAHPRRGSVSGTPRGADRPPPWSCPGGLEPAHGGGSVDGEGRGRPSAGRAAPAALGPAGRCAAAAVRSGAGADGDRGRPRPGRAGGEDACGDGVTQSPRGRYAPSPTGMIHVGNARTALVAWLSVRSRGGTFVWRVEDLDGPRVVPGLAVAQMEDLRWLGLDWDEGPDMGGPHSPYVQSERSGLYESALRRLASGRRPF